MRVDGLVLSGALGVVVACGRTLPDADATATGAGGESGGAEDEECEPLGPEACNQVDDDCDGLIDEGLVFGPVGEPIRVPRVDRWPEEDCPGCPAIREVSLGSYAGGLVALQINGSVDRVYPHAFFFRLDSGGEASAVVYLSELEVMYRQPVLTRGPEDTVLLTYCGLFGYDPAVEAAHLDGDGEVRARSRLGLDSGEFNCATITNYPSALWSGDLHFFAWVDSSSTAEGYGVVLQISDADLVTQQETVLYPDGSIYTPPMVAQNRDRVLVLWSEALNAGKLELEVLTADDGSSVGRTVLESPAEARWTKPRLVPHEDGWVAVIEHSELEVPADFVRVDRDGRVTSPIRALPYTIENNARFELHAVGGRLLWVVEEEGSTRVVELDGEGREQWWWSPPGDDVEVESRRLAELGGRAYLLYTVGPEPQEMFLQRFGCG